MSCRLFIAALACLISLSVFGQGACNNQTSVTYQGYEYDIVEIGDQCWFAENCRYLPDVSSPAEVSFGGEQEEMFFVYDYWGTDVEEAKTTEQYQTHGVLYNWPAAMSGNVCPSGWVVPNNKAWGSLMMTLGMDSIMAYIGTNGEIGTDQGYQMKSTSGWDSNSNGNGNGSNSSGFNALPSGIIYGSEFPESKGQEISFWSQDLSYMINGNSDYFNYKLRYDVNGIVRSSDDWEKGMSVRCVQCNGDEDVDGICDVNDICTDLNACNFDAVPTEPYEYLSCLGCTDSQACNYDIDATNDDSSCLYDFCSCQNADYSLSVEALTTLNPLKVGRRHGENLFSGKILISCTLKIVLKSTDFI